MDEDALKRTAIYPGTFDPITNGHVDVIQRATKLFDEVIVAVSTNPSKSPLFSVDERVELIGQVLGGSKGTRVESFFGLLADYAKRTGANAIVRGLRAVSDFEFEFQMALVNRKLDNDLITVFLMPHEKYTYLNSTIVKEVAHFGGDVSQFVPEVVLKALARKLGQK